MIRGVAIVVVLVGLGSVLGCTGAPRAAQVEEKVDVVSVSREGVMIARGRAEVFEDEIRILQDEYERCEQRRAELRRDVSAYKEKAATVWQDPSLNDAERAAYAKYYRTLAEKSQNAVDRHGRLMSINSAGISALKNKRERMLRLAERLEETKVAAPR